MSLNVTKRRAVRQLAEQAARRFGTRLESILRETGISRKELSAMTGIDDSTLYRICRGETKPMYVTAVAIVKAVVDLDRDLGIVLGRELLELLGPENRPDADYNGDGKEDRDDMIPAAAHLIHSADDVLMLTLDVLADGRVDDYELIKITCAHQKIRTHSIAHQYLAGIENASWQMRSMHTSTRSMRASTRG